MYLLKEEKKGITKAGGGVWAVETLVVAREMRPIL